MSEIKDLVCPICGEPTSVWYGNARKDKLCRKHAEMLKNKQISVNDDGLFFDVATGTILNPPKAEKKPEPVKDTKNGADELTCIICGEPSNGKHFCFDCYKKYNKKIVYIKIKNCKEFDPLGAEYESDLICRDGHIVKSEPERNIDNWLFEENIKHIYEKEIRISENESIRPDWCLPGYIKDKEGNPVDVYIEYWGIEGSAKYEKIKNYKLPIYKEKGLTLVNINADKDKRDISSALEWKVKDKKNIKPYDINFLEK